MIQIDLALLVSNLRQETMLYQPTCPPLMVTIIKVIKYFIYTTMVIITNPLPSFVFESAYV